MPAHLAARAGPDGQLVAASNDQLAVASNDNAQMLGARSHEMDTRHGAMVIRFTDADARITGLGSAVVDIGANMAAEGTNAQRHGVQLEENAMMKAQILVAETWRSTPPRPRPR